MIKATLGNISLLQLPKTAFLSSRKIPASAVLTCYEQVNTFFTADKLLNSFLTAEHLYLQNFPNIDFSK